LTVSTRFLLQVDSFKTFTQEADAIDSHLSSCRRLLPEFAQHLNSEELDVMSKRQNMLAAMIESYEKKEPIRLILRFGRKQFFGQFFILQF
jgi:hypothetical protein